MPIIINKNDIRVQRMALGPFETNAYVVVCVKTKESLVVDAPGGASEIIENLMGTQPRYILLTHDHFDHTGALAELRSHLKIPLAAHREDSYRLETPPEIVLDHGHMLTLGNFQVEVLHTPGHTPGSLCFKIDQFLFAGDTIFPGGPGRTNAPGDFRQILTSITEKIFPLPDDTVIYPGHGLETAVREAKEEYAVFASRPPRPDLYGDILWLSS